MATFQEYQGKKGKRYTARIRAGTHVESKTFGTKTAAKQWAKHREVELKEKPHLAGNEAHKHNVGDAIDRYLQDYLPHKGKSLQQDQPAQLRWWKDRYGGMALAVFQAPTLVEARDALARQPKRRGEGTLSPATVNRHLAAMSVVLALAHREWHWIPQNPMAGVRKLPENNARARYLSDEGENSELARLLEACRISESPLLYPSVLMALTTGARAQEILGLRWGEIDLNAGTVTFYRTKNSDIRTVALSPEVVELLKPRRGIGKALAFPSPFDPTRPIDIRSAWETALRRANIPNFRFHDLRHTALSYLAMEGSTSAELAGVAGHRTLAMVQRYSHLSPSHVAQISTKIAGRIKAKTGEGR